MFQTTNQTCLFWYFSVYILTSPATHCYSVRIPCGPVLQVAWSLPQCWVPTNGPHDETAAFRRLNGCWPYQWTVLFFVQQKIMNIIELDDGKIYRKARSI